MQAYLKKHGNTVSGHTVKVNWELQGSEIIIEFTATKRTGQPWLADETKTDDWAKNWGLWNTDVLECFLQLRSHSTELQAPYLEVQVSPLNQPFALIITKPRETFFTPKVLDFSHNSSVEGKVWRASMRIKFPADLKGHLLYGGFFACLDQGPREFYALEPNAEAQPDFHRPDLFLSLSIHE